MTFILNLEELAQVSDTSAPVAIFFCQRQKPTHMRQVLQHERRSSKDLRQLIFYTLTWQNSLKPRPLLFLPAWPNNGQIETSARCTVTYLPSQRLQTARERTNHLSPSCAIAEVMEIWKGI